MLTSMWPIVARKNLIETVKGVVKLKGQTSKLVKFMFFRALAPPWVDVYKNFLAKM